MKLIEIYAVILEYCAGIPQLEHATVQGEVEHMIDAEVEMRCEQGYSAEVSGGGALKMHCSGSSDDAGSWQANGECKG